MLASCVPGRQEATSGQSTSSPVRRELAQGWGWGCSCLTQQVTCGPSTLWGSLLHHQLGPAGWEAVSTPMGRDEAPGDPWSFGLTGSLPRGLHLVGSLAYEATGFCGNWGRPRSAQVGWTPSCMSGDFSSTKHSRTGRLTFSCPGSPTRRSETLQSGHPCQPQAGCFLHSVWDALRVGTRASPLSSLE